MTDYEAEKIFFTLSRRIKKLSDDFCCQKQNQTITEKITLTPTEILNLGTVPITLISAKGEGTLIQVLSIIGSLDFNSSAYTTHTNLNVFENGTIWQNNNLLTATADIIRQFTQTGGTLLSDNTDVQIKVDGGNPAAGDSPITIYVTYIIITL